MQASADEEKVGGPRLAKDVNAFARQVVADAEGVRLTGGTDGLVPNTDIVIFGSGIVGAGKGAEKGIAIARRKDIAGTPPHSNVVVAFGERLQRSPANNRVLETTCQGRERNATKSRVKAIDTRVETIVTCQRGVTDSDVSPASCVFPQRIGTDGRVKVAA